MPRTRPSLCHGHILSEYGHIDDPWTGELGRAILLDKKDKTFTIFQVNTYQICTFFYKVKHTPNSIPKHFSNYFQINSQVHNYNTRQATDLHPPFYHTSQGQFSLKYRGTTLYDKYSTGLQLSSLNVYKNKLKDVLVNQ